MAYHQLKRVICRESSCSLRNWVSTFDVLEPGFIRQTRRGGKEVKYQVMVTTSLTGRNDSPSAVLRGKGGTCVVPWTCLAGIHCEVEWHDWQELMKWSIGLHHNRKENLVFV
jgi:hypothetical protein